MTSPTEAMRKAWVEYGCRSDRMQRISFGTDSILVAPPTVDAWKALERVLEAYDYHLRVEDTDSYNCRDIKNGGGKSLHSYGIALDINWKTNPYRDHAGQRAPRFSSSSDQERRAEDVRLGRADTDMTREMIDAAIGIKTGGGKRVFGWGGDWRTLKDAMHFQIEVTPAELAKGIDWTTVPGGIGGVPNEPGDFFQPPDDFPPRIFDDFGYATREEPAMALREGDSGAMVIALQTALKALHYPPGDIDGQFGPLTRDAVLSFQANNMLMTTGIADAATLGALAKGKPRMLSYERMTASEDDLAKKGSRVIYNSGWNRWMGIATGILGALGLGDTTANLVSPSPTEISGSIVTQIQTAMNQALTGTPARPNEAQLRDFVNRAIQTFVTNTDTQTSTGGIDGIFSMARDVLGSASPGPWALLLGAGYFIWRNANSAAKARLDEHRTGTNLDR